MDYKRDILFDECHMCGSIIDSLDNLCRSCVKTKVCEICEISFRYGGNICYTCTRQHICYCGIVFYPVKGNIRSCIECGLTRSCYYCDTKIKCKSCCENKASKCDCEYVLCDKHKFTQECRICGDTSIICESSYCREEGECIHDWSEMICYSCASLLHAVSNWGGHTLISYKYYVLIEYYVDKIITIMISQDREDIYEYDSNSVYSDSDKKANVFISSIDFIKLPFINVSDFDKCVDKYGHINYDQYPWYSVYEEIMHSVYTCKLIKSFTVIPFIL